MNGRLSKKPNAFTLLEVILALSLSALVLIALGMAVDFHLRALDNSFCHVEEAQLARVVLNRIADDLRGAVRYDPLDVEQYLPGGTGTSSGESTTSSTTPADSTGTETEAGMEETGETTESTEEAAPIDETEAMVSSTTPQTLPGIYGTLNAIQVDVSRLPRADQFAGRILPDGSYERPSDVKSITYFVYSPETTMVSEMALPEGYGLTRREVNRATARFEAEGLGLTATPCGMEMLAPEVAALEFMYFDGMEWWDSWDSAARGTLPVAVRIDLYIIPKEARKQQEQAGSLWQTSTALMPVADVGLLQYSLTVYIPNSEPSPLAAGGSGTEEEEMTEDESGTDSGTSTDGSSPSSSGSSTPSSGSSTPSSTTPPPPSGGGSSSGGDSGSRSGAKR